MSEPYRRSPLHHRRGISSPGLSVNELPFQGKLVLRGSPGHVTEPVRGVVGCDLPVQSCTASSSDNAAALWIGPDEWWIVTEASKEQAIAERLHDALLGTHHQLVDVTDFYTTIELEGPRAAEVLMKITPLDLHPRAFPAGSVAGSMFGHTQATLWHVSDDDDAMFRLFVRWSTADYLWCLLAEGGREFGLPPQAPLAGEVWRLER